MGEKIAPLRVVLDTNVLVSSLLFGGAVGRLHHLWTAGLILPLVSRETFNEFRSVLSYPKFKLTSREIATILNDEVLPFVEPVEVVQNTSCVCRDPRDDMFLSVALQGRAAYLVTGDDDLLVLKEFKSTRIVTVRIFLELFSGKS